MNRYLLVSCILFLVAALGGYLWLQRSSEPPPPEGSFAVTKSESEWRELLDPKAFRVLRQHGTEPSGTSPLNSEKRDGVFRCGGCEQELFSSAHKYDSGTGWPSFYQPATPESVGTSKDFKLVVPRTEVHCSRCGGHLGHVFSDGPQPTGRRYCINGVALKFAPE